MMAERRIKSHIDFSHSQYDDIKKPFMPVWLYAVVFITPAALSYYAMNQVLELDTLYSAIVALAVMNGSINSVIAILTIRLDGHSSEALDNLETIMSGMEQLEDTLEEANTMVESFTTDLDSAKELFDKVGVDLGQLDLEPVAEVVEKLKENKDGFSEILDNMKDVDVSAYITQAKGIDWKQLLDAAEDILSFIKSKDNTQLPTPSVTMPKLPDLDERFDVIMSDGSTLTVEPKDDFFEEPLDQYEEPMVIEAPAPKENTLTLSPPKRRKKILNLDPPRR
jgi:hypothetical protein